MYRLLFENRGLSRERFETRERSVVIGRDAGCSLRLSASGVDVRHASIERRADGYYVNDIGSANGVLVNGQRITSQRLRSGDELELGSARLRFEIVHEPPSARSSRDLLQVAAGFVITTLIVGETVLLTRIFSEPRPRAMRVEASKTLRQQQAESPAPAPVPSQPLAPVGIGAPPGAVAVPPTVLNRMLKIVRVDRSSNAAGVTLQVVVKAQVGERELSPSAVAVSVQFFTTSETVKTLWLTVPSRWDNFSARTLAARFLGPPEQLRGYIVRTYYRKQLQDEVVAPPELLSTAPTTMP